MSLALPERDEHLPTPAGMRARQRATPRVLRTVQGARAAIRSTLAGRSPHVVAVVGPCSIHDPDAALRYASQLAALLPVTRDVLTLVMRTYFEKPRTRLGWKGYLLDPARDGSCDLARGLESARELLLAIGELGLPCAAELLEPLLAPYLEDLLSLGVIGARTAESPVHRELASGLGLPVGFKNSTSGDVQVAVDAVIVSRHSHAYPGLDAGGRPAIVRTRGNPDTFVVLRGGAAGPNFDSQRVGETAERLRAEPGSRPVWIDCSHDNSRKDPHRQGGVLRSVIEQRRSHGSPIGGFFLESHLHPGRQEPGSPLAYGVSITDACLGWSDTEALLLEAADRLRSGF
jgi:3-deoxy-7-phosphoheptulonate synthase